MADAGGMRFLRWMLFMSSVLYPALIRGFYAGRYTASPAGVAEVKQFALAESDRAFAILDAALAERDWLVGDRYSINSFADSRIDGGTVRPSAAAVLRFNTISNLVGS